MTIFHVIISLMPSKTFNDFIFFHYIHFPRLYLPINEELKENATECDLIPMNLPNSNTTDCLKVNQLFCPSFESSTKRCYENIKNIPNILFILILSLGTWKAQRYWKSCVDYTWLPQWIWYWMDARNAKRYSENWFHHHKSWSYCKLKKTHSSFTLTQNYCIIFRLLDGAEVS